MPPRRAPADALSAAVLDVMREGRAAQEFTRGDLVYVAPGAGMAAAQTRLQAALRPANAGAQLSAAALAALERALREPGGGRARKMVLWIAAGVVEMLAEFSPRCASQVGGRRRPAARWLRARRCRGIPF
jgi:hypothetical protein